MAAILVKSNKDLVIDDFDLPNHLSVGNVLVKMISSGICGAQLNEISATKGEDKFLPHLLGHEGFGEVIDIGPGVNKVKPGDLVVLHWRPNSGLQTPVVGLSWQGKKLNAGSVTTFSSRTVVCENRLTRILEFVNPLDAPLYGCSLTTAMGVLSYESKLAVGDNLIIGGAGGVGLQILLLARQSFLGHIAVVDKDKSKLELALKLGADSIIDSSTLELSKGNSKIHFDLAIDTSGNTHLIEYFYTLVNKTGSIICVGVPNHREKIRINTLPLHFGKSIFGTEGGRIIPERDIPKLMSFFKSKPDLLNKIPKNVIALQEINSAIYHMKNGKPGRFLIDFRMK